MRVQLLHGYFKDSEDRYLIMESFDAVFASAGTTKAGQMHISLRGSIEALAWVTKDHVLDCTGLTRTPL